MAKKYTYQQAFEELNNIVEELQNENVTIDLLTQKIQKAKILLEICNAKLKATEQDVNIAIESLNNIL